MPTPRKSFFTFLFFLSLYLLSTSPLWAVKAVKVDASGRIHLDNGKTIVLAGIHLSDEAFGVIPMMISSRELDFKKESSQDYAVIPGIDAGYLFIETQEISFPFNPNDKPREGKWMLNKMLLTLGMATAEKDKNYDHKEDFMKEEALAREKGEFIETGAMVTRKRE